MNRWGRLLLLALLVGAIAAPAPQASAQTTGDAVSVYYVGPQDLLYATIQRAAPHLRLVDNPELAQVYVLNDPLLESAQLQGIGRLVLREEVGLVVFLGPHFPSTVADIRALLGVGAFNIAAGKTNPQRVQNSSEPDPLQTAVAWNSAPEVRARTVISNPNLLQPVVVTAAGEPLVQRARGREQVQVFVVGAWFDDASNAGWAEWPYFDYFIYRLLAEAANAPRLIPFQAYPRAPVPRGQARWFLGSLALLDLLICFIALFVARRSLFLRPERWAAARFDATASPSPWTAVGFQRPLAALLLLLGIGPLLLWPWLIFQLQFLPTVLLPSQQAWGFWEQAGQWLTLLWVAFDAGVGVAAVRYFVAWRSQNPKAGLRYLQWYIWWQMLSGAVQMVLVVGGALFILPRTALAHLTFYLIARVFIQFPGFLMVFRLFFRAEQRFDYEQRLVILTAVGGMGLQTLLVLLFREVLPNLLDLDATIRSVLGLGAGAYFAEWLAFGVGVLFYKQLGYDLYALFIPAFDRGVLRRALRYGLLWTGGTLAVAAGTLVQGMWLVRYVPEPGSWQMWAVMMLFPLACETLQSGLYDSLMPALVEAVTQDARTLARYMLGQGVRYGVWAGLLVLAALALVLERLAEGWLGEAYVELASLLAPVMVWAVLQGPAWTAERLLEAEGRPGRRSVVLIVEQGLRLLLLFLFVPRWGTPGMWPAFLLPLLVRTALGWHFIRHWRVKVNFWQTGVAPFGAALLAYNGARALLGVLPSAGTGPERLLWFLALLLLSPCYGFLTGLLGGWDDGGLEELHQAAQLSDVGLPLALLLWRAVRLGARLSPLHGLFPVTLRAAAQEEARALSARRPPPA